MEPKGVVGASQPRWIPVTERLPESGTVVLVYCRPGGFCDTAFHLGYGMGWAVNDDYEITHWMPLPQKPEGL